MLSFHGCGPSLVLDLVNKQMGGQKWEHGGEEGRGKERRAKKERRGEATSP